MHHTSNTLTLICFSISIFEFEFFIIWMNFECDTSKKEFDTRLRMKRIYKSHENLPKTNIEANRFFRRSDICFFGCFYYITRLLEHLSCSLASIWQSRREESASEWQLRNCGDILSERKSCFQESSTEMSLTSKLVSCKLNILSTLTARPAS